jgi:hypothetical protein
MSYDDPAHWHGRAKEMRVLAEQMDECVSKQMMRRIAEDYECLARTAEQRAKRFPSNPLRKTPVVPAEVRQFTPRKNPVGVPPASILDVKIPSFLKRGPATAEEVGARPGNAESAEREGAEHEQQGRSGRELIGPEHQ